MADNGDGMEQEKLGAVFDEFYRGDESRSSGCDGNGLGLYVCRYIIKEHGGKIRAYTKDGFHVEMCLPEAAEHEKEKAMRKRAGSEKKRPCWKLAGREKTDGG